ncbi:UvrD-helicase domain-containing protein [Xanthomonas campestris]|uniref:UvrD-helicase domain-containing protein n=1 Tax=Xanthomonas campestris TaxID=339 RepID=UPI0024B7003E|nr:UvrD-helicase domain-containing protein [Xanthomonas campestris]WHO90907.1 AAA family ATPase [Xanthomonas campestris]
MSSVPSPNRVLLSAAGSGKTTLLVRQALERPGRRIAIVTYTLENLEEIRRSFEVHAGAVPAHVTLHSWYGFLLRECIRPYQAALCPEPRIETILFVEGLTNNRAPRTQVARHYLAGNRMYSDRAADFAVRCDELTQGQVMARLAAMYDELYIDEVQDLAGYDLDLVERLLKSDIDITLVGDTRQATYATNYAQGTVNTVGRIWRRCSKSGSRTAYANSTTGSSVCAASRPCAIWPTRFIHRCPGPNQAMARSQGTMASTSSLPATLLRTCKSLPPQCSGMTGGMPATDFLR